MNTNIEFFAGNQWRNIPMTPAMSRLPKPVFNIIKRVTSLFVASLTTAGTTIQFEPLTDYDGENQSDPEKNAAEFATAEVEKSAGKVQVGIQDPRRRSMMGRRRAITVRISGGTRTRRRMAARRATGARSRWSWWTGST